MLVTSSRNLRLWGDGVHALGSYEPANPSRVALLEPPSQRINLLFACQPSSPVFLHTSLNPSKSLLHPSPRFRSA